MKNILWGLAIVLSVIIACNPPQSTTGNPSDSKANKSNTTDTTATSTHKDSSMRN